MRIYVAQRAAGSGHEQVHVDGWYLCSARKRWYAHLNWCERIEEYVTGARSTRSPA